MDPEFPNFWCSLKSPEIPCNRSPASFPRPRKAIFCRFHFWTSQQTFSELTSWRALNRTREVWRRQKVRWLLGFAFVVSIIRWKIVGFNIEWIKCVHGLRLSGGHPPISHGCDLISGIHPVILGFPLNWTDDHYLPQMRIMVLEHLPTFPL